MISRRFFVGEEYNAELDIQIPIGEGFNSTKPSLVLRMLELLGKRKKVLEVGTGCGWQTALLTENAKKVYSIERSERLYERAVHNLKGYSVNLKQGDGLEGWKKAGKFDGIIVCAAVPEIDGRLVDQLRLNGVIVAPVGDEKRQVLKRLTKTKKGLEVESFEECGFALAY